MGAAIPVGVQWALVGLTAATAGYSAYSTVQQGKYEAEVAGQNAQLASKAAGDALQRGKEDAAAARMRVRAIIGAQRAKYAASGAELSGTPVDVLADTAQLGELDALTIENNAAREAYGYRNDQVNVLAHTGTIGLLMDCDTTGIEHDYALGQFKKLAGGGYFKIIKQRKPIELRPLGYPADQIDDIVA